jgi:hypothetical protein
MVMLVMTSFLYIAYEQQNLGVIREEAREMRRTRQALMSVDRSILVSMAQAGNDSAAVSYGRAMNALDAFGIAHLPETVVRDNRPVPATAALAALKGGWDDVVAQLEAGQRAPRTIPTRCGGSSVTWPPSWTPSGKAWRSGTRPMRRPNFA